MKRRYFITAIFLFLMIIAISVIIMRAETHEYTVSDLMKIYDEAPEFVVGGSIKATALSKYRIIYDTSLTENEIQLIVQLRDIISAKTGTKLDIYKSTDGKKETTYTIAKHEILIGSSLRPEGIYLDHQTWCGAGTCAVIGKKLVLSIGEQADASHLLKKLIEIIEYNLSSKSEFIFNESYYEKIGLAWATSRSVEKMERL